MEVCTVPEKHAAQAESDKRACRQEGHTGSLCRSPLCWRFEDLFWTGGGIQSQTVIFAQVETAAHTYRWIRIQGETDIRPSHWGKMHCQTGKTTVSESPEPNSGLVEDKREKSLSFKLKIDTKYFPLLWSVVLRDHDKTHILHLRLRQDWAHHRRHYIQTKQNERKMVLMANNSETYFYRYILRHGCFYF